MFLRGCVIFFLSDIFIFFYLDLCSYGQPLSLVLIMSNNKMQKDILEIIIQIVYVIKSLKVVKHEIPLIAILHTQKLIVLVIFLLFFSVHKKQAQEGRRAKRR